MQEQQVKSLKKLIIWIIVLGVMMGLFYLVNFLGQDTKEIETEEETSKPVLSYTDKLDSLLNSDYIFTYLITKNNDKTKFEGIKTDDKIIGFKETNNNIIKYKIIDGQTYEIKIDNEMVINNLYEDIDASLLDLNYVISMLNQTPLSDIVTTFQDKSTVYDYNFSGKEEGLEIIVTESEENISNINIRRNNESYDLTFTFD